ncbi:MAG: cytochrome c oxidase subunit 3 [Burkholderiales bacterium]|nr:cytochrome c oxidase subunit 3 [Burkholderiales bacterium]MDE2398700.1 cytochrome c oxidase subunit 3 [Burkholderiales bacterium]
MDSSTFATRPLALPAARPGRRRAAVREPLPGDLAIWFFIAAELAVFGVLFAAYAFARRAEPGLFAAGQAQLPLGIALANTLALLTSSFAVARAVESVRADRARACARWLGAALALGLGFVALKLVEFDRDAAHGFSLSRNLFDMFYLSLTVFHFMHVLMGMLILGFVAIKAARGGYSARAHAGVESAASYWHMVDLLWIVLFALVYLLH